MELDDKKFFYQQILTITKLEKETKHQLNVFIKKNSLKCATTARAYTYTQAWLVNCPITQSNYKHDTYSVLLLLKSGWRKPIKYDKFVMVLINHEISALRDLVDWPFIIYIMTSWTFHYIHHIKGLLKSYQIPIPLDPHPLKKIVVPKKHL